MVSEVPHHCEQIVVFNRKSRTTVWFSTKHCLTSISWGLSALWLGFIASMFLSNFRQRKAKYRDRLFHPYKYDSLLIVSAVNGWTVCKSPRLDFSVTAGQSSVSVKCPLLCDDSSLRHIVQSQCQPHGYVQQFTPEAEVYGSTLQLTVGNLAHLQPCSSEESGPIS